MHEAVDNELIGHRELHQDYPLYKIPKIEADLARKLIYHDKSGGNPLQVYMEHFTGRRGKRRPGPAAHVESFQLKTS